MSASHPMPPDRVPRACAGGVGTADVSPDLAALRRRIAALERRAPALEDAAGGSRAGRPWSLGMGALDDALPEGGLVADGLHEAAGASAADGPAAAAFLAALLARRVRGGACGGERGAVLVCQSRGGAARFGRLHGPGWRDLGLEPADLLILRARRERDVPWAMEEGLRCGALAAVLAEVEGTRCSPPAGASRSPRLRAQPRRCCCAMTNSARRARRRHAGG